LILKFLFLFLFFFIFFLFLFFSQNPALHIAIHLKEYEMVEELLAHGADPT